MSDQHGPWGGPRPPRDARRIRVFVWLALLAGAVAGFLGLRRLFPGSFGRDDWAYAGYYFGFIALVSGRLILFRRLKLGQAARNIAIWAVVVAVVTLVVVFREDLAGVGRRVRSALIPAYAVTSAPRTLSLTRSDDGGFYVIGAVNGATVRFLIDTGASDIVLSPADARRAGTNVASLTFARPYETANGTGHGATIIVDNLTVGPIVLSHIPVVINGAAMDSSLLGQTFLSKLESFEVRGDRLLLRWRG